MNFGRFRIPPHCSGWAILMEIANMIVAMPICWWHTSVRARMTGNSTSTVMAASVWPTSICGGLWRVPRRLPSGAAYLPADANLDGVVDTSDFNLWNANKFTATPAWCAGDFNADGVVDASDFNIWNSHKFTSASGGTVPEPVGWPVLVLGFLCGGAKATHKIRRARMMPLMQ